MSRAQPLRYLWWLVSDAAGVVALVLISLTVLIGLAMAAKALRRPTVKRAAMRLHEHLALAALAAICVHGLALLGDHWLRPGLRGITVPFALSYRPGYTGAGIIAGYLALLLGPTFYLRRRIGARRWRKLHRATVVVWLLSVAHALGAGSDATRPWLRFVVLVPVAPVVYLLVVRAFSAGPTRRARAAERPTRTHDPHPDHRLEVAHEMTRS
jgi:methionine sulfoxide reductase heme-binding subunit